VTTLPDDAVARGCEFRFVSRNQHDTRAGRGERVRDRTTDARTRPGDERDALRERKEGSDVQRAL
jgi:hypothetical protein